MAEKTPFTPASIYRGKNLADSVKAAGYSSVPHFSATLQEKNLPNIGQTGGQESLELLNKQIRSKPNFNPDDIYLAVQNDVKKIQTEVLGTTAQTKGNRGIRQQITNTLDDIQKSFLTVAGKVKLTKISWMMPRVHASDDKKYNLYKIIANCSSVKSGSFCKMAVPSPEIISLNIEPLFPGAVQGVFSLNPLVKASCFIPPSVLPSA